MLVITEPHQYQGQRHCSAASPLSTPRNPGSQILLSASVVLGLRVLQQGRCAQAHHAPAAAPPYRRRRRNQRRQAGALGLRGRRAGRTSA